jgi:antitoxin component of RelBE/YafQ-DinJ toxin-antitoxin module
MTTQIVFTVDPKIKARAMKRAKREGVPFASVLKLATKAFAEGRFSVDIAASERFNAKTTRILRAALRDVEEGKNLISFKNTKEMDAYLRSL